MARRAPIKLTPSNVSHYMLPAQDKERDYHVSPEVKDAYSWFAMLLWIVWLLILL